MEFIVNAISILTVNISRFFTMCKTFFQSIIDFFNNVLSIFEVLWFWIKTLLSWVWKLITEIFDWTLFDYLFNWFNDLSLYIWYSGALFISSILFVVIIRIIISWVFKMFRLNQDYNTMKTKWKW